MSISPEGQFEHFYKETFKGLFRFFTTSQSIYNPLKSCAKKYTCDSGTVIKFI